MGKWYLLHKAGTPCISPHKPIITIPHVINNNQVFKKKLKNLLHKQGIACLLKQVLYPLKKYYAINNNYNETKFV